jgi:hypothetical protein
MLYSLVRGIRHWATAKRGRRDNLGVCARDTRTLVHFICRPCPVHYNHNVEIAAALNILACIMLQKAWARLLPIVV